MAGTGPGSLDELSRTLRELRHAAGLSGTQAAEQVGFSQAKISRIEKGVNVPTPEDVEALAKAYRAASDIRRHLVSLAEDVKAANRRVVLSRRANRAEFQARIGRIEAASEQLREFSPIIIPGLLQTVEYMREIFNAGGISPSEVTDAVARRLERQAVLDQPGRRITVLTTEGALGWAADEPNVMLRQLEHIRVVAAKPAVRVGIIPFGVPRAVFPVSNYNLFDERAVVPGILRTQVVLVDSDVPPYVDQFARLEQHAVFDDAADAILTQTSDRYRTI